MQDVFQGLIELKVDQELCIEQQPEGGVVDIDLQQEVGILLQ